MTQPAVLRVTLHQNSNSETKSSDNSASYMPALDGIRAIAILLVLVDHFYFVPILGPIGVKIFFVLSGFLITGILLRCKREAEDGYYSKPRALWLFYVRRFLRIMPLFYLVLLISAALNMPGVRNAFWWHASYLSNVYFARLGHWEGTTGVFWSLAVEEQFYMVWPWAVFFTPRRLIPYLVCGLLLTGSVLLLLAGYLPLTPTGLYCLPFMSLIPLATGALIAVLSDESFGLQKYLSGLKKAGFLVGIPMLVGVLAVHLVEQDIPVGLLFDIAISSIGAWLIISASDGARGLPERLLAWEPLRFIGAISYGIYILHILIRESLRFMFPDVHSLPNAAIYSILTISIATLSWRIFESPINRLKRHFEYRSKGHGAVNETKSELKEQAA
jgi:peptidoglycan/LPS O-acetylase OafA/YrhL